MTWPRSESLFTGRPENQSQITALSPLFLELYYSFYSTGEKKAWQQGVGKQAMRGRTEMKLHCETEESTYTKNILKGSYIYAWRNVETIFNPNCNSILTKICQ